jgi:predicted HTH transcriptional regulator
MNLGGLSNHICAMANTSGGYITLGIDGNKNVKTDYSSGSIKRASY